MSPGGERGGAVIYGRPGGRVLEGVEASMRKVGAGEKIGWVISGGKERRGGG